MNLQQLTDALEALTARVAALEAKAADDQPPHKPSPDATGQPADDQPPHK